MTVGPDQGPTMDQVEEFLSTGTVKRRVSLLIEAIKTFWPEEKFETEVDAWRYFLQRAVQDRVLWTHLAPALVIADAIRGLDCTIEKKANEIQYAIRALNEDVNKLAVKVEGVDKTIAHKRMR